MEWEFESMQQGVIFVICMSGGGQGDVQVMQCIDFVVIDFWEDDLFFYVYVVVVVIIEGFGIQVVEVMYVWQGDGQQMIQEFVYLVVMQGDFDVDWLVFMDFEVCDGFMSVSYDWFLISDFFQIGYGVFDDFFVIDCFVKIYVQGDFGNVWNFYYVCQLKFFFQFGCDFFLINFF